MRYQPGGKHAIDTLSSTTLKGVEITKLRIWHEENVRNINSIASFARPKRVTVLP